MGKRSYTYEIEQVPHKRHVLIYRLTLFRGGVTVSNHDYIFLSLAEDDGEVWVRRHRAPIEDNPQSDEPESRRSRRNGFKLRDASVSGRGIRPAVRTAKDYAKVRIAIDALLDVVGDNEKHPLAALLDYLAEQVKTYEDEHFEPKKKMRQGRDAKRNIGRKPLRAVREMKARKAARASHRKLQDASVGDAGLRKSQRMGDALATLGRKVGLTNKDIAHIERARDKTPAKPASMKTHDTEL